MAVFRRYRMGCRRLATTRNAGGGHAALGRLPHAWLRRGKGAEVETSHHWFWAAICCLLWWWKVGEERRTAGAWVR